MSPSRDRVALDLPGLTGLHDLFRLSGGSKKDPAVERWLSDAQYELRSLARRWFARIHGCGDDVLELMHDGCPVACVADAAFAYVNTFKSHVNVGFFRGAYLADPAGLLEGRGRYMRHVKLKPGRAVDEQALQALITAAYRDIKTRLEAP